jgi:general secretion pathway protein D
VVEESNADAVRFTPTIAKREVKTTVTIPDRSTVILSGLIREDTAKIATKVPWLGDLPLVGFLFRSTSDVKRRTNLLIFVTPRIVTDMKVAEQEKSRLERAGSLQGAAQELDEPNPDAEKAVQKAATEKAKKDAKKKPKVGGKP